MIREFWDYDGEDQAKAIEISAAFKAVREQELIEMAAKKKAKAKAKK